MSNIKAYKINQLPRTICILKSNHFQFWRNLCKIPNLIHAEKQVGILSGTFGEMSIRLVDCAVSGRVGIYVLIKPDFCLHHVLVSIFGLELFMRNRSAIMNALV